MTTTSGTSDATTTTTGTATSMRIDDPSQTKPVLLTLPASDLPAGQSSDANASGGGVKTRTGGEDLLLIQLPAGQSDLPTETLLEELSSGRAYIVGPGPGDDDDDDNDNGNDDDDAGTTQACLVIEGRNDDTGAAHNRKSSRGRSYALGKVETSNALVMVPPQIPTVPSPNKPNAPEEEGESPPKKQRTSTLTSGTGNSTNTKARIELEMHAQLLQAGGSGASFLDLRPHPLHVGTLRRMLQRTVYDPYDSTVTAAGDGGSNGRSSSPSGGGGGKTIAQLASVLRVSQSQVRYAMTSPSGPLSAEAFQLPPRNSDRWGTLSEEAREDACMGIVAVLAECEEYADAFATGATTPSEEGGGSKDIVTDDFVKEVVRRSAEAEGDGTACLDEIVVEQCLRCCSLANGDDGTSATGAATAGTVKLDLDKIALILAHHLFNRQTTPWTRSGFQAEWQRLMPCIGERSKPNMELLAGVALERTREELPPAVARALADKTNGVDGKDGFDDDDDKKEGGSSSEARSEMYLTYLPEHRLLTVAEKRFDILFREKERWTLDELRPYVKRVAEEAGSSVEEVLMKHTLSVEEGGIKIFTKR